MPEHVGIVCTASLSNSILANYPSDFWKVTAKYRGDILPECIETQTSPKYAFLFPLSRNYLNLWLSILFWICRKTFEHTPWGGNEPSSCHVLEQNSIWWFGGAPMILTFLTGLWIYDHIWKSFITVIMSDKLRAQPSQPQTWQEAKEVTSTCWEA